GVGASAEADAARAEVSQTAHGLAHAARHPFDTAAAIYDHVESECRAGATSCGAAGGGIIGVPLPSRAIGLLDDVGRAGLRALGRASREGGAVLELLHGSGLR